MAPTLYATDLSAPVRSVFVLAKAINLELDIVTVDLFKGEQLAPEFLKINPEHTVPTLVDGDFILWDSHAINIYLVEKYGKDDTFYPKDPEKRGVINQKLFFNAGTVSARMGDIMRTLKQGAKTIPKDKVDNLIQAYGVLEETLERTTFVAGNEVTIADFSLAASISSCNALTPIAENRFPKIAAWLTQMESLPYFKEANRPGLDKYTAFVKSRLF